MKVGFLSNIVKIFPSLAKRPLYLMGESYAGMQEHTLSENVSNSLSRRDLHCAKISLFLPHNSHAHQPYITKTIFSSPSPPVTLKKIAIGDGTLGSTAAFEELPTVRA
jgi:carboxypeptidase D